MKFWFCKNCKLQRCLINYYLQGNLNCTDNFQSSHHIFNHKIINLLVRGSNIKGFTYYSVLNNYVFLICPMFSIKIFKIYLFQRNFKIFWINIKSFCQHLWYIFIWIIQLFFQINYRSRSQDLWVKVFVEIKIIHLYCLFQLYVK